METVERALSLYGAPVYVRKQIVHNAHVVRDLEGRGAIFVEARDRRAARSDLVLSAHGVARPSTSARPCAGRHTIDATCPLVTKVHVQARRYAAEGRRIVLIGHAGHEEVVGTMGKAPEATVLVESVEDAEALELPLTRRSPTSRRPRSRSTRRLRSSTCSSAASRTSTARSAKTSATRPRTARWAVKEMLQQIELLLVIGSRNSSNSNRLVEVARLAGVDAHLIDDETQIDERWVKDIDRLGPARLRNCGSKAEIVVGIGHDHDRASIAIFGVKAPPPGAGRRGRLSMFGAFPSAGSRRRTSRSCGWCDGAVRPDATRRRARSRSGPARVR